MSSLDRIFKAYDIRGIFPDQIDARTCRAIGWAFAEFARSTRIVVGRDMRQSGVELAAAFTDGVRATGTDVVDIGLASTDLLYFASGELDAPGAMFTASHNPAAYNGIKLCLAGARPVGESTGLVEIHSLATEALESGRDQGDPVGLLSTEPFLGRFAEHVRTFVEVGDLKPLKIVADTANGMGGLVAPAVFEGLPFDVQFLFQDLDGNFPNHPADPIQPENLADLKKTVLATGADVGLAFDGDADRVFLVDEKAETVSGSLTTALVAKAMLEKEPGSTVLYNLICSKTVPEVIAESGGKAIRTRVGHSFIKQVMAESGAVFGGEHSGHYYFRDNFRADSGLIAAMVVLEAMSRSSSPLSELLRPFRRYWASGEINTEVAEPARVVDELVKASIAERLEVDMTDGLTVDHGSWWYNLRPSNTEPLLRLNVEASDEASGQEHVRALLATVGNLPGGSPVSV